MNRRTTTLKLSLLALVISAFLATAAWGIQPPQEEDTNKAAVAQGIMTPELNVAPSIETIEPGSHKAFVNSELQAFFTKHSTEWKISYDSRNNLPHLIQGAGIALIPGKGNSLTRRDLAVGNLKFESRGELKVEDVAGLLQGFMKSNAGLLGTETKDLRLDMNRSLGYGQGNYFWSVEFQQYHKGIPVEGAHVFFRINHGNIVQFGVNRAADINLDINPAVSDREAIDLAVAQLDSSIAEKVDRAALKIYPTAFDGEGLGEFYKGSFGLGYTHRLVWEFRYIGANDHGYKVLVDAHSGEILEFTDETLFADVEANVYPVTNTDPLLTTGLPFATVSNGGTQITDANGSYNYTGGTATVQLNGRYTNINDNCGNISLSNSTDGNIDFGGAGGTDCTTPGVGGAGNTHSARTGFYHLTNINRTAANFLPGNGWLNGTLTANMNINNNCNAFWNGSTVNFYTSGGGCGNTGEIAAVFLHEWGHGMDSNAGGTVGENGTGEAIGDSFAFIELRDPCIGENFSTNTCFNCNPGCTGVRDVSAYGVNGISTVARPDTVETNSGMNCDRFSGLGGVDCPYTTPTGFPYRGPMGYEGHCESYIASSANWDLAQLLIGELGTEGGWSKLEELWYGIMTPMGSAYQVASGGQCNPSATVNGCGASNWYTLYIAADDDDGNLANGTPNGCRIWEAFNDHGIACGSQPTCSVVCTPQPVADAGADVTINEGGSTTIGTAAQAGHTYSWSPGGATTATINVSPTTTTTYTVTATTSCNSAQDSVTVTVIPVGSNGPQDAAFNGTYQAPTCLVAGSSCDTNGLVDGRGTNGPEPNQPNTINDSCADGTAGTYHSDESNDRIVISTLDGGNFSEGDTVEIEATVWAWTTPAQDTLDLYYAADATNPSWTLITSITPSSAGQQTLSAQYTLPSGGLQAVRAQFRYQSDNSSCSAGTYNDRDDVVFAVETAGGCTVNADCDNGLFCDGSETCNVGSGVCESGTAVACGDGVSCTDDSCNEATDSCDNTANNGNCDNGLFCDGSETCDAVNDCQAGTAPNCDDGVVCTVDSCNEGSDSCNNAPDDGACDNGQFCDGSETCNAATGCEAGSDPCSGSACDEGADICLECSVNADCDNGLFCDGSETCNAGTCEAGTPPVCDDGAFCNGTETCNEGSDSCNAGSNPCAGDQTCNETTDICEGGASDPVIWMSFRSNTAVPGVGTVRDEDIVSFDEGSGTWALEFDGSDVGLGSLEISGMAILPSGNFLLSFTAAGTVGGIAVDDSDIVEFTPTSLGATTAGTFSLYFDGSDVALTSNGEDVDGIALAADGRLIISSLGGFSGTGASGADEDLFIFTGTLGASTSGSFAQHFDGSDVALNNSGGEDVDAIALTAGGNLLFSTVGTFSVSGVSGQDEDIVEFAGSFGSSTSGTFSMRQDLSTLAIAAGEDIGSLHIVE